uniref:Uncharacterized protein n=1 Tax=Anguilla anguilla TaxID=7936 RepID=A0A0E9XM83_ANGAN
MSLVVSPFRIVEYMAIKIKSRDSWTLQGTKINYQV